MMTNEEKILAELEAIRAEPATVRTAVSELKAASVPKKPRPNEQQRAAFHRLIDSISDEDAAEFGRLVDEMELQKGGML